MIAYKDMKNTFTILFLTLKNFYFQTLAFLKEDT